MEITIKAIILNKDLNKFLIVKTRDGKITLPGGRMEKDEQPIDTLKRELKEEINLDEFSYKILFPIDAKRYKVRNTEKLAIYYLLIYRKGKIMPKNEIERVKWVNIKGRYPRWIDELISKVKKLLPLIKNLEL